MMWLSYLGTVIEDRRGTLWLAVLVFGSAIVSNLGQYFIEGPSSFGGMSGVVYALFGYVWMKTLYHPMEGMYIDSRNVNLMLLWLVLCTTGAVGPIANGRTGSASSWASCWACPPSDFSRRPSWAFPG